jgi:RNA polymerase sigma-70 factor, ECF subfamily
VESPEEFSASTVRVTALADEQTLVAAMLQRDRKATAEFVARYADSVYFYVRSRLIPRLDLVDDLVQEVFLAAWENLPAWRGDSPLTNWLQGIARHKIENYYRTCLRAALPLDEAAEELPDAVSARELEHFLDRERQEENVRRILGSLPEAYSLALLWRYWEQCSAREMARRTGKSEKAIERLLARAREMFRERWKRVER